MTFSRCIFLRNELVHIIILHLIPWHCHILLHRLIVHHLDVLNAVQSLQTQTDLGLTDLLNDALVHPERHFLLDDVWWHMQVVTQLLGADAVLVVFEFVLVEIINDDGVDWQALKVEAAVLETQSEIRVTQTVVVMNLAHDFQPTESLSILLKHRLHTLG